MLQMDGVTPISSQLTLESFDGEEFQPANHETTASTTNIGHVSAKLLKLGLPQPVTMEEPTPGCFRSSETTNKSHKGLASGQYSVD